MLLIRRVPRWLAILIFSLVPGNLEAAVISEFGVSVDSIAPITYSLSGNLSDINLISQALPSQTAGFTPASFDPTLGTLNSIDFTFDVWNWGSITTTLFGTSDSSELVAKGLIIFEADLTLLNDGIPIGGAFVSNFETTSCSGFGLVVSCTQSLPTSIGSLQATGISPLDIGLLQMLIEPVGRARVGFSVADAGSTSAIDAVWEMQIDPYVTFHFTPPREVPLPGAIWLFLTAVSWLAVYAARHHLDNGKTHTN